MLRAYALPTHDMKVSGTRVSKTRKLKRVSNLAPETVTGRKSGVTEIKRNRASAYGTDRELNWRNAPSYPDLRAYFGGCRPGLVAHLSASSLTLSSLGRFDGFDPFGIFGRLLSLPMRALLSA